MIQGCWYSRRSTDRWTLSKNSTTRQTDSRVWRKAGLYWEWLCISFYIQPGLIFIPCQAHPRMDLIPNLSLSLVAYPSIRPPCLSHVTMQSREISSTVLLSNGSKQPTADLSAECIWRNLPSVRRTPHRAGPTSQTPYQILVLTEAFTVSMT
jgi:hypothetical protein